MYTRALTLGLALAGLSLSSAFAENKKPNILVIVADDLGWGELGVQGFAKDIPTPNIDALANGGTRFTNGYVSGPYCSPTRAALLTGRYQQRFGHEFNPGPATGQAEGTKVGLDLTQKTLGDRLQSAGYTTAWIGKSHLGYDPEFHPLKRGFNQYYGFLGGAHTYLDVDGKGRDPVQRDGQPVAQIDYLTTELGKETSKFITEQKGTPWFTYLAYNAVHGPLEAPESYLQRFREIKDAKRQKFAAMLAALDDSIGGVLQTLRETGQEEDTLIFFIADNGGPTAQTSSGNGPLRGFKAQTWEGGVRVAWFVQWKGHLPAGKVDKRPVIQLDILPTALAAAGVAPQEEWKLDGTNLLPYLKGQNADVPHEALYWRFGQQIAIRQGDWKLVKAPGGSLQAGQLVGKASTEGAELYNLAEDIGETKNLAAEQPERVKQLAALWDKWNEQNVDPKWSPGNKRQQKLSQNAKANANAVAAAAPAAPAVAAPAPAAPAEATTPAKAPVAATSATGPWKSGDKLAAGEAPKISGKGLAISAHIEAAAPAGVIVAQGAQGNGFALHVVEGKLALSTRAKGQLSTVQSSSALPPGKHQVLAKLESSGKVTLQVDGQTVGEGQGALVAAQPKDGLTVGSDGGSPVGEYQAPNNFSGQVEHTTIQVLP